MIQVLNSDYTCFLPSFMYSAKCFHRNYLKCVFAMEGDSLFVHRNTERTFKHSSFNTFLKLLIFAELCDT
jgi:hypothetical protein